MSDAPVHELSREVATELARAADVGDTRQVEDLRTQFGLGHADLHAILDQLREVGMASEVAPGEWTGREEPEPTPVAVRAPEAPAEDPDWSPLAELVRSGAQPRPSVRLTPAIADALDEQALGKIVKAGITEAREAGAPFVLEVG